MLSSALIAATIILGSGQARAGYISPAALVERDGVYSRLAPIQIEAHAGMSGAGETCQPQFDPDTDGSHAPCEFFSLLEKRSFAAHNTVHDGLSGSSSRSASSNGPSSRPAGYLLRLQVPPPELTSLLPPEKGDAHPFSVASFLFRPPRAAYTYCLDVRRA